VILTAIDVRDHFSTTDPDETACIARFVGELVEETEEYVKLRHCLASLDDEDAAQEFHVIMKNAIVERYETEV